MDIAILGCSAQAGCTMHRRAARDLEAGDHAPIYAALDIYYVVSRGVWRNTCSCGMWDRIKEALGVDDEGVRVVYDARRPDGVRRDRAGAGRDGATHEAQV